MNRTNRHPGFSPKALAAVLLTSFLLVGCAATPESPQAASELRNRLNSLQNHPELAQHGGTELREAEEAVRLAEQPVSSDDASVGAHRVYIAERSLEIARAKASARYAESQREQFAEERDRARLEARSLEVERAREDTSQARTAGAELQRQIDELEARPTDRGLVLTLGDVLFATGSAELQRGSQGNLDKLVSFLNQYPERDVLIEGHTDNVGSRSFNQTLSLRRADSVKNYLTRAGISSRRISTAGMGMDRPVASNDTESGRLQNRRVEVIIENPPES